MQAESEITVVDMVEPENKRSSDSMALSPKRGLGARPLSEVDAGSGFRLDAVTLSKLQGDPNPPDREGLIKALEDAGWIEGIAAALHIDPVQGIMETDYDERIRTFGINVCPKPPIKSFWRHCWEALEDIMMRILIVAGIVSIIIGSIFHGSTGWIEGFAIIMAVVIVTIVSAANNVMQDKRFRAMEEQDSKPRYQVLRGGRTVTLTDDELLTGDLVHLKSGQQIPADGLVAADTPIQVNESTFTGESKPLMRDCEFPFLYSSTEVVDGTTTMLVTSTGPFSAYGRILGSLEREREPTPLQLKLEEVAALVGKVGGGVAVALFIVLLAYWLGRGDYSEGTDVLDFFIISVTIVVVAVPEGLPLAVTVSLAYSLSRMARDKNLVKVLSACETMGNVTTICSDKTGTLTQNMMTVTRYFVLGRTGTPAAGELVPLLPQKDESPKGRQIVVEAVAINSDAVFDEDAQADDKWKSLDPEKWRWENGNQTEAALMAWMTRSGVHVTSSHNELSVKQMAGPLFDSRPFDSRLKRSSIILGIDANGLYVGPPQLNAPVPAQAPVTSLPATLPEYAELAPAQPAHAPLAKGRSVRFDNQDLNASANAPATPGQDTQFVPPPFKKSRSLSIHFDERGSQDVPTRPLASKGVPITMRRCLKGAAERVLASCDRLMITGDKTLSLDDWDPESHRTWRQKVESEIGDMVSTGLRTIAFAYRDFKPQDLRYQDANQTRIIDPDFLDTALTQPSPDSKKYIFLGVVGIMDPLRPETYNSVRSCQKAGIVVRMVTGDHVDTARYIARDCGIVTNDSHLVIEAIEFSRLFAQREELFGKIREALLASPPPKLTASEIEKLNTKYDDKSPRLWVQAAIRRKFYIPSTGMQVDNEEDDEEDAKGEKDKNEKDTKDKETDQIELGPMESKDNEAVPAAADNFGLQALEAQLASLDTELGVMIPALRVMARSQPQDKENLVKWLKEHHQIVGVTGDGTNDAPALKEAHIGLAMGSGTAVAKRAAGIVIQDDNFHTIVRSVMWGRSVYDNIRKFVQFQLTINLVALLITLIGAFTGKENPLKTIQLLWVNLIMDSFAALALGTELPTPQLLERHPYTPKSHIISVTMWRNIIGQGVLQIIILCIVLYQPTWFFTDFSDIECDCVTTDPSVLCPGGRLCTPDQNDDAETYHLTLLFNTFVWLQIFNQFNARKVNRELNVFGNIFSNWIFWVIVLVIIALQVLFVEVFGSFAETTGLSGSDWGYCILLGATSLPWGLIIRFIPIYSNRDNVVVPPELFEGAHLDDPRYDDRVFHQEAMHKLRDDVLAQRKAQAQNEVPQKPQRAQSQLGYSPLNPEDYKIYG